MRKRISEVLFDLRLTQPEWWRFFLPLNIRGQRDSNANSVATRLKTNSLGRLSKIILTEQKLPYAYRRRWELQSCNLIPRTFLFKMLEVNGIPLN